MSDLTPEQALTKQYEKEAEQARAEAEKYKNQVVTQMTEKLAQDKASKLAEAEATKQQMEEAFRHVL